ncbi:hypothetical protein FEE96_04600 [Parasedimentitalea maritima]|uniref:Uncharacterized protein n=1 Tax=Parasedimentitalea maritima TaxID=2578117 RepID=A0ABY2UYM5_9RHOB|nr:hypothetical protein [Zongyanglinia marina]TLP67815.1 hypothetical protein FEE96_04600 [Zongyanglinia marina]
MTKAQKHFASLCFAIGAANIASATTTAKSLGELAPISQESSITDKHVRCVGFFESVRVLWAAAAPYGEQRDILAFVFKIDPSDFASKLEIEKSRSQSLVQKYLNSFHGVWPKRNVEMPIFKNDKAICLDLIESRKE